MLIGNIASIGASAIAILKKHVDAYGAETVQNILTKDAKTTSTYVPDRDQLEIKAIGALLGAIDPALTLLSNNIGSTTPTTAAKAS